MKGEAMKRLDKIRVGFIGAGRMGLAHSEILSRQQGVSLVGVADNVESKAKKMAELYSMRPYSSYKDLLENPDIDAVWISTPPNSHRDQAVSVLEAGKHVLLEKPIALSLSEADEIVKSSENSGAYLMMGFMKRFAPRFVKLKALLRKGVLGDPIWCIAYYNGFPDLWFGPEWCWNTKVSGGLVVENTVHYIDMFRWLIERPVAQVYANLSKLYRQESTIEDSGAIIMHFDVPLIAMIACGMNAPEYFPHEELRLVGTKGAAQVSSTITFVPSGAVETSQLRVYKKDLPVETWNFSSPGYEEQDIYFLESIRRNQKPEPSGEEGKKNLEIALACLSSAKSRSPTRLPLLKSTGVGELSPLPWEK